MDWMRGVAMQLALQCHDYREISPSRDGFVGATLRLALLVDLIAAGRLSYDDDVSLDCRPTGFAPADELLRRVEADPDRDVAFWIGKGPKVQRRLAKEWVKLGALSEGGWRSRPYFVLPPASSALTSRLRTERARLTRIADGDEAAQSETEAALVVCAVIARVVVGDPMTSRRSFVPSALLDACPSSRWLLDSADEYLVDARINSLAVNGVVGTG